MKICSSLESADEIRVSSIPETLRLLGDSNESPKRIILSFQKVPSDKMVALYREHPNICFEFASLEIFREFCELTEEKPIRAFLAIPATTWELVQTLLYYQVTDIVIGEPLIFDTEALGRLRSKGVNIRIVPHKPQPSFPTDHFARHHFLLPQHVALYESTADTLDFYTDDNVAQLYLRDKSFGGTLDAIFGVQCNLPATMIGEDFVKRRLNCGQACAKNPDGCHFCARYIDLAMLAPSFNPQQTGD